MTGPRVLVLGCGSIGTRHAQILLGLGVRVMVSDPDPTRAAAIKGAKAVPLDLDAIGDYDGIVVASPTSAHVYQVKAALQASASPIFVEKPLATALNDALTIAEAGNGRLMVGYNLRFHSPVERLMALARDKSVGRILGARLWFGSYLPDWRPHVDYRTTYSARSDLGGGVLLDAIHELDMAVWLMGPGLEVRGAVVERVGSLDIDVEDSVKAVLRHPGGVPIEISLDYLSRKYRRGIEVVADEATLRLDWARGVIEIETAEGTQTEDATMPVSRSYERQMKGFLSWIAGESTPPVDGHIAAESVRLADDIRNAAR